MIIIGYLLSSDVINYTCRVAYNNSTVRHIFSYYGTCSYKHIITNINIANYNCTGCEHHVVTNRRYSFSTRSSNCYTLEYCNVISYFTIFINNDA